MYNFFMFFFGYKEIKIQVRVFFAKSCPFYLKMLDFSSLKSKNGALESNILCAKILGTVKFFLKSKNFLKSNVLKLKIHCTATEWL